MSSILIAGNTSGSVTLSAPDVAGTTTLTLPSTSGNVLTSASSVANSQLSAGHVLQVVSATDNAHYTFTAADWTFYDVSGLQVSITPSSSSSKILVMATVTVSQTNGSYNIFLRLARGSTALSTGNTTGFDSRGAAQTSFRASDGSDLGCVAMSYLDSPATTSAVTYKVQVNNPGSTSYVNRPSQNTGWERTGTSTITIMEIKG